MYKSKCSAHRGKTISSECRAASGLLLISFLAFMLLSVSQVYATQLPSMAYSANALNGSISIINRISNSVVATIPLIPPPMVTELNTYSPYSIAVDNESVWVARGYEPLLPNTTTKLNFQGQIVRNISLSFQPNAIAVDPQFVWATGNSDGITSIARINKTDYTVTTYTSTTHGLPVGAWGLVVDNNFVWVACDQGNAIVRINRTSGTYTNISATSPVGITVDNNSVYYTDKTEMRTVKIAKSNYAVQFNVSTPNATTWGQVMGLAVDDQFVWVAMGTDVSVKKLNKATGTTLWTFNLTSGTPGEYIDSVSLDDDFAWASIGWQNKTVKINKTSNAFAANISVGGDPINFGDMTGYIFATLFGGQQGGGGSTYSVSGYVLSINGTPISGANVTFMTGSFPSNLTNGGGYYTLYNISGSGGLQAKKDGSFAPWVYAITLTGNLNQSFTLNSIGGGQEASNVSWGNFQVFMNSPPYAMNGPGCVSAGNTSSYSNGSANPGDNCPGSNLAEKTSYDLGAVWVDVDNTYISWQIMGPSIFGINGANPTFCNASSTNTQYLMIEFDADSNVSTGCPSNRPCRYGSDYQVVVNTTGYFFRAYNASLAGSTCIQGGNDCFTTNSSVNVSYTNPRCDMQNGLRLLVPRSAIPNLVGLSFEVNVINTNAGIGPPGPVESLGGAGMAKTMMSGQIDMMFQGGMGCGQYQGNAAACNNVSDTLNCKYNSQFGFCEPDMAQMDCSQFCGRCNSVPTCLSGAKGKCMIVTAPPMIGPDMLNFSNVGQNSICVENMMIVNMQMGGSGTCDSDCKYCPTEMMCNNTGLPDSQGGTGKGCRWVTDTFFNKSWCDLSTYSNTKLNCSNTTMDRCFNQSACEAVAVGGTWDSTNLYCKGSGEICFNGIDDDSDGAIDCGDSDCSKASVCGGDISLLTDATMLAKGGLNLNPMQALQFKMYESMDMSPPAMLGVKTPNATIRPDIRIQGLGIKDMGKSLGLGLMVNNLQGNPICNGTQDNNSVYFFMLDTDNNASTGCSINISGINYTGFEYKLVYEAYNVTNGSTFELLKAFRCLPGGVLGIFPAKLASSPNDPMTGGKMACQMSAAILAVDKTDIGSPTGVMRIMAASGYIGDPNPLEASRDNLTGPNNNGQGFYYSPGAVDFKPSDCFANPMACGTAFSMIGGGKFMPFEDCMSPQDDDANGLINCADPSCMMAPFCTFDISNDKTAPTVYSTSAETFKDFVMLHWTTNEPTNATITLHNTCMNSTAVATLYDVGDPTFTMDDYRPWHAFPMENSSVGGIYVLGTTYYYKLQVCDKAGNCATSGCLNFTMKSTSANMTFQFKFDFMPPMNNPMLNNTSMKLVLSDGTEINVANNMTNQIDYIKNASLKFNNPGANWTIELPGVDFAKAMTMNLSDALNATNNSEGKKFVGMDNNKWLEMVQNLGVDKIKITIPEVGDKLIKCQTDNLSNCQDVTANATFIGSNASGTTWEIPSSLGFSVYGVNSSGSTLSSDRDVYNCYPNCTMYFNLTTANASLIGIRNITINYSDDSGNKMSYNTSVWNGTAYNVANSDGNSSANLTNYNLTATDPQLRIVVNMSSPGSAHLNVTLNIQNATESQANITDSAYIDSTPPTVGLVYPANNSNITSGTTALVYNVTDDNSTSVNCTLFWVASGVPGNQSFGSVTANGSNISAGNLSGEGSYIWYVSCVDSVNNTGTSSNRTFVIDISAPSVALNSPSPLNMTNTSTALQNFNWTATDNIAQNMSCTLYINGIANYTNASTVNGTATNKSVTFANGTYVWYLNCTDTVGNSGVSEIRTLNVDTLAPIITGIAVNETDAFYSNESGNNQITLIVNVTDPGAGATGVSHVTANFTGLNQSTIYSNMTLISGNSTNGTYRVTLNVTNISTMQFSPANINATAYDFTGNFNSSAAPAIVILYNMTTPPTGSACISWGTGTTNFATVTNFAAVPFVLNTQINLSCLMGAVTGAPAWYNTSTTLAMFNFSSLDLSTQANAMKLANLSNNMAINITPPGQFGDSRIYFNTSYFVELNTTTNITLYHLPFASQPAVQADAGAAGGISPLTWAQGTGEGTLIFSVNGFSGYNVTDNTDPIITINAPLNGSATTDGTPLINLTFNGTGTPISTANIYIDALLYVYNSSVNNASCANASQGSELFNCVFNSSLLSDGNHTLNITIYDFGGAAPGRNKTSSTNFSIDATAPTWVEAPANQTVQLGVAFSYDVNATDTISAITYAINDTTNFAIVPGTGVITNATSLSVGIYPLQINATDAALNVNTTYINVTVQDTIAPAWTQTPANQTIEYSTAFAYDVNATDLRTITYTINNSVQFSINSSTGVITNATSLGIGLYPLIVNATDASSNVNSTQFNVTIRDTVYPTIDYASPTETNDTYFNRTYIRVNVTSVDLLLSTIKIGLYNASGSVVNSTNTSSPAYINFSGLPDGRYYFNATANDTTGNSNNTSTRTVLIDTIAPAMNSAAINDSYVSTGQSVFVTVNVTDAVGAVNVTANGIGLNHTGDIWNGTITLTGSSGAANISVVAIDNASNTNSTAIAYTIDNVAPAITVNSPANGSTVSDVSGNLTLNYTVVEAQIISSNVSIDSGVFANSTTSNGTTLFNFTGIAAGTHTIVITAYDNASLSSTSTTTFVMSRPVNATAQLASMQASVGIGTLTNITLSDVATNTNQSNNTALNVSQPLKLDMGINASAGANATVIIPAFTGTDANWNATTFSITTNLTGDVALNTTAHTGSNIIAMVSFVNMSNFLPNTAYTNGTIISFQRALLGLDVLYISDDTGSIIYKLSACSGNVAPSTINNSTKCYTNTSSNVTIYIPHLSGAALSNDTVAPTVNITSPTNSSTVANSYTTFSFDVWEANPNATTFCWYNLTNKTAQISVVNLTTTSFTQVGTKYNFSTAFSALINNDYNITVNCTDQNGNSSQLRYNFTIVDTTAPTVTAISASTSGSVVTLSVTTSETAQCRYATTDGIWWNMLNMTTTNSTTHSNAITYLGSASGTYYVRCNDTAGNGMATSNSTAFSVTVGGTTPPCNTNWTCTTWTTCSPSNTQTRACTDQNSCGTVTGKPSESQYCIYVAPAMCSTGCQSGQAQYSYPNCGCYTPTCPSACSAGYTQNAYPSCACVALPIENVTPGVTYGPGNITVTATRTGAVITIPSVGAGRETPISLSSAVTGVTGIIEIALTPKADLAGVRIEFSKLDAKPAELPEPPNAVYRYLQILATNVGDNLENATITFRIEKPWIGTRYNASSVKLMRYTDAGWTELSTSLTAQTATHYVFQATTPGFSYFAITAEELGVPSVISPPPGENVTAPPGAPFDWSQIGNAVMWIVGIIIIAAVAAFGYKKFKERRKWRPKPPR